MAQASRLYTMAEPIQSCMPQWRGMAASAKMEAVILKPCALGRSTRRDAATCQTRSRHPGRTARGVLLTQAWSLVPDGLNGSAEGSFASSPLLCRCARALLAFTGGASLAPDSSSNSPPSRCCSSADRKAAGAANSCRAALALASPECIHCRTAGDKAARAALKASPRSKEPSPLKCLGAVVTSWPLRLFLNCWSALRQQRCHPLTDSRGGSLSMLPACLGGCEGIDCITAGAPSCSSFGKYALFRRPRRRPPPP